MKGNGKALATVTAIIDGTGSIGAAIGPYLTAVIFSSKGSSGAGGHAAQEAGWNNVFFMLMGTSVLGAIMLLNLVKKEAQALLSSQDALAI